MIKLSNLWLEKWWCDVHEAPCRMNRLQKSQGKNPQVEDLRKGHFSHFCALVEPNACQVWHCWKLQQPGPLLLDVIHLSHVDATHLRQHLIWTSFVASWYLHQIARSWIQATLLVLSNRNMVTLWVMYCHSYDMLKHQPQAPNRIPLILSNSWTPDRLELQSHGGSSWSSQPVQVSDPETLPP